MSLRDEILGQYDIRNLDIVKYGDYTMEGKWQTWYDIVAYNGCYYKIKQYQVPDNIYAPAPRPEVTKLNILKLFDEGGEIIE